jgi:peptidylprolyl isomerase
VRKTTGIVVASGLLLSLAACAPGAGDCTPDWTRGGLAASVTATGDFGVPDPGVKFPLPLVSAQSTSSAVISAGDGAVVRPGEVVNGVVTLYDAVTGQPLNGGQILLDTADAAWPFFLGAVCAPVGSRIAAVGPSSELLGDFGTQAGLPEDQTVVLVADIDAAYPGRADGSPVPPQNGLPTVSLAPNGQPGLSFTGAKAPADLRIEVLKQGGGDVVAEGDQVVLKYTGVIWDTHTVFDSSWQKGMPAQLATGDAVPGFSAALVGQPVGSQVLAVIPPAEGYGDTASSDGAVGPTDTMVFVIDILGIAPPAAAE